ncbi:MAG: hypothetical protein PHS93_08710 [Candidatus Omnitrophica bacterium]|nr:hypothetical protein [Candidatus Omnitrophota bacterium]
MNRQETLAHADDIKIVRQRVINDLEKSLPDRRLIAEKLLQEGYQRLLDDLKKDQDSYNKKWYRRLFRRIF